MNIIVVGCGRTGANLAYQLFKGGHRVTVIDQSPAAFLNLPADYNGRTVEGDALLRSVLHRAGIEQAHGLAAVTNSDSTNAVTALIACTVYHIPRVIVRSYDPKWQPLHEILNLPAVSSISWGIQRIEDFLLNNSIRTVLSPAAEKDGIFELIAPEIWQAKTLPDLPPGCRVVSIKRMDQVLQPCGDLHLEKNDIIYLAATAEGIEILRQRLNAMEVS